MATELIDSFRPESLRDGVYVASSLTDAYGDLLAAISIDRARYLGEHIDEDGVKMVAAFVGPKGRRMNPSIGISREFFTTVLKDYVDWKEKWWREAIQNSADAGATEILCEVAQNEDGTFTVSMQDNGGGMSEDVLINKFLMLGGSTKTLGSGASGGFGKAKELLILPWLSWSVHTRNKRVDGVGVGYETRDAPYLNGTRLEVVMPADEATSDAAAISFISKCYLPNINFRVTKRSSDGTTRIANPKAILRGDTLIEEVEGSVQVYTANVDYDSNHIYVRVNGLFMFSEWVSSLEKKQVLAEIIAPSIQVLTANRDGFRSYEIRRAISDLTSRMAKDVLSALRSKKGLIRKKYSGAGKFQARRDQADLLSQITSIPPTRDGRTEISDSDILAISRVMSLLSQSRVTESGRISELPDADLASELLRSIDFAGAHHVEESVRQLAWSPDFFVVNEIEGFKVPSKFMPETMKPQPMKLARTWTELCRFVLMQLGNFRPFGVGWVFSSDFQAAFLEEEEDKWLLLNPYTSPRRRDDTFTPTDQTDLKRLYALAIHECTHLADGIDYHDESFAAAMTNNMARCADGFRKIRKIVGTLKLRDAATADIAANPSRDPRSIAARLARGSSR